MVKKLLLLLACLAVGNAHAVLEVQITEGVEGGIPIAIVPFASDGSAPAPSEDIAAIVSADLQRSGRFSLLPEKDFLERPSHGGEVNFESWRALGADNLVVGRVRSTSNGNFLVQFQLFDIYKKDARAVGEPEYKIKQILGYNLPTSGQDVRRTAHYISDLIYEALTGQPGAFSTRIAYVTALHGGKATIHSLQVADADGHNPFEVLRSSKPIMSPSWAPDGKRLAYVSFENGRPGIYVQDLANGTRQLVSSYKGINGAPVWAPDGKRLALTLSHEDAGNPEIYVLELATKALRRITYNSAIDTEPTWAPDGKSLVFTSDRSGRPQLYRVAASGGRPARITFEGNYNARAAFSPDGKLLAMVTGVNGGFRIGVLDLETNLFRVVSDGKLDESPSFAPNGSMILYATEYRQRGVLAAVSVEGRGRQRLVLQEGDVREPAWAPFINE